MSIFSKQPIKEKNIFQNALKLEVSSNFSIELENFLADYENSLESVTRSKTIALAEKYKINLKKDFIEERKILLNKMLKFYFQKKVFSKDEYRDLKHLNDILCLDESIFTNEYEKYAKKCYRKTLEQYIADENISEAEKTELDNLCNQLKLSEQIGQQIYSEVVKTVMDRYTKPIFNSEIFSPQDEERMYVAAKRLGLKLKFPQHIQTKLCAYRENWEMINGRLPILNSDIRLQTNESLHFKSYIRWMEYRNITQRINYQGLTYSKKIIGGLKWKAGTIIPNRITSTELQEIDSGTLYITNKRIIFNGQHENKTINLNKIINFQPYTDGILIERDAGKSPFFAFSNEIEKAATILANVLS